MSRRCQLTGSTPGAGKDVSHSPVRTLRTVGVTVLRPPLLVPSLGRHVRLRLSAKGIEVVDREGIESVVARLRAAGERV